ncbi:MAG TPA: phytanoyl-CoA dioxygenase family protein, partial [Kofleriaceae bacterium]|nr:phytanoyl-CoA dioxygenase family protein [Kofleriaceae bacterium]
YRGPILEKTEGRTLLRKVPLDEPARSLLPAVAALCRDSMLQRLVDYAGARAAAPRFYLQAVLQQAGDGDDDPQTLLHADTFHPTVKAWLFLTDVALDAGPFTYVPGSHRLTAERLAWERRTSLGARSATDTYTREGSFRIDPGELGALGLPPPRALAVPANSLVVADTFGFHARGRSLQPFLRVELWAIGRRNPFLPWTALDTLVGGLGAVKRGEDHWSTRTGSLFDPPPAR